MDRPLERVACCVVVALAGVLGSVRDGTVWASGQQATATVPLESVPVVKQTPTARVMSADRPGRYHGHRLWRGIQLPADGSWIEYRLAGQYGELFGRIYMDDANRYLRARVDLIDGTNPANKKTLFEAVLGPNEVEPFRISVHGIGALVVSESSCPGCTVLSDVVATLTTGIRARRKPPRLTQGILQHS